MKIYRITTSSYINDLSGTGAKLYGGRWNEKGTPILYCANHISLAILEILVHFDGLTIPNNLHLLTLEIPKTDIHEFSHSDFKNITESDDAEFKFKNEGMEWVKNNMSLALKVPSAIVHEEYNILINPLHISFTKLKKINAKELNLDKRLFK